MKQSNCYKIINKKKYFVINIFLFLFIFFFFLVIFFNYDKIIELKPFYYIGWELKGYLLEKLYLWKVSQLL